MTFSRQILLIFGSVAALLVVPFFLAFVIIEQIKSGSDELIADKIHVFTNFQNVATLAKGVEAAGAHVLISGRPEAYEVFKASHLRLRENLRALLEDPKFLPYKSELEEIARLEIQADTLGREPFEDRVSKRIPVERVADVLSKSGLPILQNMQERLGKLEAMSLKNWQDASTSMQALQSRSQDLVKAAFAAILVLIALLIVALWAILRQRHLLDERRKRLLEKEQVISNARKAAVEIVAHDLRSPLASIQMCLDSLEDADEQERSSLHRIGKLSAQNALRLINQILDHTKIERDQLSLEKLTCDMKVFLAEQIGIYQNLCTVKNVRFTTQLEEVPNCLCDTLRIGQVLSNLIGNALKFSQAGHEIRFGVSARENEIHFSVQDEGPGLKASQIEHIFDRYWQSPGQMQEGIGLGLAISKSIVDAHGGRIWVVSKEGEGSAFYFTIPI